MNDLVRYLNQIVEPTVDEFKKNPGSIRHAFVACVALYHSIDRVTYPKNPGNLRKVWERESPEFQIVDVVAHHFKHVKSDKRKTTLSLAPRSVGLYGSMGFNTRMYNDTGQQQALDNLLPVVERAVEFVRQQTNKANTNAPSARRSRYRQIRE